MFFRVCGYGEGVEESRLVVEGGFFMVIRRKCGFSSSLSRYMKENEPDMPNQCRSIRNFLRENLVLIEKAQSKGYTVSQLLQVLEESEGMKISPNTFRKYLYDLKKERKERIEVENPEFLSEVEEEYGEGFQR